MANKESAASKKKIAPTVAPKKITKKAPAKTKEKEKVKVVAASKANESIVKEVVTNEISKQTPRTKKLRFKRKHVILLAILLCIAALLYLGRSWFVAALVNGQPISRLSVIQEVEKQNGKTALDSLIRNSLIEQEARKQNITVSDKEINDEITKLEGTLSKQGQKLDQVLQMQGMDRGKLRELIRLDKLVGKMVGKDITVSDEEISKYIESNKTMLPAGQSEADQKKTVAEQIKQQKLSEKVSVWLQDLQKKANIIYFVNY
jgi:hypothetical protein